MYKSEKETYSYKIGIMVIIGTDLEEHFLSKMMEMKTLAST